MILNKKTWQNPVHSFNFQRFRVYVSNLRISPISMVRGALQVRVHISIGALAMFLLKANTLLKSSPLSLILFYYRSKIFDSVIGFCICNCYPIPIVAGLENLSFWGLWLPQLHQICIHVPFSPFLSLIFQWKLFVWIMFGLEGKLAFRN